MEILKVNELSFGYPGEQKNTLSKLSFSINEGDFVVLFGPSGSGKSTLLRLLKTEVRPHGKLAGDILYKGKSLSQHSEDVLAKEIGMVFQDPENQIVMDSVLEELVFGLENFGIQFEVMRRKVAEIVHFFGIESLLARKTAELSGGQKQLVNLSSVLLLEPKILLLDEPTAQLDPVASKNFLSMLRRMNEELGITVIIAEHQLEDVLPIADYAIVLDNGTIVQTGPPNVLAETIAHKKYRAYLPTPTSVYFTFGNGHHDTHEFLPLTIKEGQQWLRKQSIKTKRDVSIINRHEIGTDSVLLEARAIDFQYNKENTKVLDNLSIKINSGDSLSIVGGNGTGKSTLLKVLANLLKPQRGSIRYKGKKVKKNISDTLAYLPQNPRLFFLEDTVIEEMKKAVSSKKLSTDLVSVTNKIDIMLESFGMSHVKHRHPYDLSGGEMQKAALACMLLRDPEIILMDEPTKGLDPVAKKTLINLLKKLNKQGLTIVSVTHDIEFAAEISTRSALMFQGEITTEGDINSFFKGNAFYTTAMSRLTRHTGVPEVLTIEEALTTWQIEES